MNDRKEIEQWLGHPLYPMGGGITGGGGGSSSSTSSKSPPKDSPTVSMEIEDIRRAQVFGELKTSGYRDPQNSKYFILQDTEVNLITQPSGGYATNGSIKVWNRHYGELTPEQYKAMDVSQGREDIAWEWLTGQQEQLDIEQFNQGQLDTLFYQMAGYNVEFDETGKIIPGSLRVQTEEERVANMSPLEKQNYDIAVETASLNLRALKGELDISPALEEDLMKQRQQVMEVASRRGSNVEQALIEFDAKANMVREEARRGIMTTASGLLSNTTGITGASTQRTVGLLTTPAQMGMPGIQMGMSGAGTGSSMAGSYMSTIGPTVSAQQNALQMWMTNKGYQAQQSAGMYSMLGSIIGIGGGIAAGKWIGG